MTLYEVDLNFCKLKMRFIFFEISIKSVVKIFFEMNFKVKLNATKG